MAGDVRIGLDRQALPITSTQVTWSSRELQNDTCAAALFLGSLSAAGDGTASATARWTYGFVAGTSEVSMGFSLRDNAASSYSVSVTNEDSSITAPLAGSTALDGDLTIVGYGLTTEGITLDATDSFAAADVCAATLFSGADVDAASGVLTTQSSIGATTNVTGLGFRPDLIFFLHAAYNFPQTVVTQIIGASFGAACWSNGQIIQYATTYGERHGQAVGVPNLKIMNDRIGGRVWNDAETYEHEVTAIGDDGFSVTTREAVGAVEIAYLALKFDGCRVHIGEFDTPTTATTKSVTGVGFLPQWVLLNTSNAETVGSLLTDGTAGGLGWGMMTMQKEYCGSIRSEDNDAGGSVFTDSMADSKAANQMPHVDPLTTNDLIATGPSAAGGSGSMEPDGFILDFEQVASNAKKWWYVAVEAGSYNRPIGRGNMSGGMQ